MYFTEHFIDRTFDCVLKKKLRETDNNFVIWYSTNFCVNIILVVKEAIIKYWVKDKVISLMILCCKLHWTIKKIILKSIL